MLENPFVRLRKACGITQKDFAAKYDFAKMSMVYMEAGVFTDVSDRFNEALATECHLKGVDVQAILSEYLPHSPRLSAAYHYWQNLARLEAKDRFQKKPPYRWTAERSPFYFYMQDVAGSTQGFCKALKVPPVSATRYATGATVPMPEAIEQALRTVNYLWLHDLIETQQAWVQSNS